MHGEDSISLAPQPAVAGADVEFIIVWRQFGIRSEANVPRLLGPGGIIAFELVFESAFEGRGEIETGKANFQSLSAGRNGHGGWRWLVQSI
jgi:hypothetical protein